LGVTSAAHLLDFEAAWTRHSGHKEEAIRARFGIPPARYYQLLHRAARDASGIEHDPLTARMVRERVAA
jgi:hypothetical protein